MLRLIDLGEISMQHYGNNLPRKARVILAIPEKELEEIKRILANL